MGGGLYRGPIGTPASGSLQGWLAGWRWPCQIQVGVGGGLGEVNGVVSRYCEGVGLCVCVCVCVCERV